MILLDDFDNNRSVRLNGLLYDLVSGTIAFQCLLVLLHLLLYLFHRPVVLRIFLQHEVQCLTDAGRLDSLHNVYSPLE